MRSQWSAVAFVPVALVLMGTAARADQIALTSGVLDFVITSGPGSSGGLVRLEGDRGFTFRGNMRGGFDAPVGNEMPPGTSIALSGGATGADFQGVATLDGVTYSGFGGLDSTVGGAIRVRTAPALLPAVLAPSGEMMAAFTLDLVFGGPTFEHSLFGSGTATIFLEPDLGFEVPSWRVTGMRAVLSAAPAVPEPTTLLLIAPGLGWALRRRQDSPS